MKNKLAFNLSEEEFMVAVKNQPKPLIIPLCAELPLGDSCPLEIFQKTRTGSGFLLESMEGSEKLARYSFIGLDPALVVTLGSPAEIAGFEPFTSIARDPEGRDPVDRIKSVLARFQYVNLNAPRFFGGMVGYFAYDCVYSLFPKAGSAKRTADGERGPDARFMLTRDCIVLDHRDRILYIFSSPLLTYESDLLQEYHTSVGRIRNLAEKIATLDKSPAPVTDSPIRCPTAAIPASGPGAQEEYERAVCRIREHIAAGDIFQAVLSRRMDCEMAGDPFSLYKALRTINPSPYMYFLDFGDEQVIGASPEMLVRVEKRRVTTVPIAGTRPRGRTPAEDQGLADELLHDEKERAEHTMLVDLARNDLGRVCRFGSVEVTEFMNIEKFSHVQHIVSTVTGVLRDNLDCYDAFRSCFPAGTVSGAPKIRAMQIIGEQEPCPRGIYAGAVGYIGFDRNLDFAIAIRTVLLKNGKASIQVGAGIVADSVPALEWKETENKAAAMVRAVEQSGAYP